MERVSRESPSTRASSFSPRETYSATKRPHRKKVRPFIYQGGQVRKLLMLQSPCVCRRSFAVTEADENLRASSVTLPTFPRPPGLRPPVIRAYHLEMMLEIEAPGVNWWFYSVAKGILTTIFLIGAGVPSGSSIGWWASDGKRITNLPGVSTTGRGLEDDL